MLVTLKRAGCGLALVALKMTDQKIKKLAIEYGYTDNRKHINNTIKVNRLQYNSYSLFSSEITQIT